MTAAIPGPRPPAESHAPNPTVAVLVARAQAGDGAAFAAIYDRYVDMVFRYIYYRVRGQRQVAEDLTSEVWVRALRNIGGFRWQGRDLGAWLITIARNLVADHFKSGRYRYEQPAELFDSDTDGRPTHEPDAGVGELDLLRALHSLTPAQRDVLILRFLLDLSVAETAQAMGSNAGAVKVLTWRATQAVARQHPELAEVA